MDCEAKFSMHKDPMWQTAHDAYVYYKSYSLDKEWNYEWIEVKQAFQNIQDELKLAK